MQKSENKIKPMHFWSDGYEEHGIFRNDLKKIREDELAAAVDSAEENEFVFEPVVLVANRQAKRRKLRNFLKSKVQKALRYARFYRHE